MCAHKVIKDHQCFFWDAAKKACIIDKECPVKSNNTDVGLMVPEGELPLFGLGYSSWRKAGQCPPAEDVSFEAVRSSF